MAESVPTTKINDEEEGGQEECELKERELKREVLRVGEQGPISNAARAWLMRSRGPVQIAEGPVLLDLVTEEERKARVEVIVQLRARALEKEAKLRMARAERRTAESVV
ncbi:hypothetical protein C8R44DRAFT_741050 [Mycena epipterygia]|nr:hypothetical protein C8R44DRAFT_741050 [Mycena epipterygia]